MHAAATPLRECVYPSVWNDDFRGHDCSAYGCEPLGHGLQGKTCACGSGSAVRKIAARGHECNVADEWNSLLLATNVWCFAQPVVTNYTPAEPSKNGTIVALRTYLMERIHGQPLGKGCSITAATRARFNSTAVCQQVDRLLVTGASILPRGHDNFWGNFFIPATGLDAVEGTDGCPLVIADLNQHGGWVANTTVGGQTVWQPHGGPAGWFSETPSRSTHNPGGSQWHWTACHALRPLFPCVGLPTTASTHALHVCSASTVAAATNSESDSDLLSVASSSGAAICRTVHTRVLS